MGRVFHLTSLAALEHIRAAGSLKTNGDGALGSTIRNRKSGCRETDDHW